MKNFLKKIRISTVITVLILFSGTIYPSALASRKLYFPLSDKPEVSLSSAFYQDAGLVFTPQFLFPFTSSLTLDFSCDVIHSFKAENTVLGDAELQLNMLLPGRNRFFLSSLAFSALLPNGPDSSLNTDFRFLSYGKDMLSASLLTLSSFHKFRIYTELKYSFISSQDPLYQGLYINPVKMKTYETLFGFNFQNKDAFFYKDKLKDDFLVFNAAFDYAVMDSFFAGVVFSSILCWHDETCENTGFEKTNFSSGIELIYSKSGSNGLKFKYMENYWFNADSPERCFFLSFFTEI